MPAEYAAIGEITVAAYVDGGYISQGHGYAEELADTYYVALLHASGCTSNGHEATQLYGDDIAHRAAFYLVDPANPAEILAFYKAHVGVGRSPEVRARLIEDAIANAGPRAREAFATMCEVAQRFAGWLELGSSVEAALESP